MNHSITLYFLIFTFFVTLQACSPESEEKKNSAAATARPTTPKIDLAAGKALSVTCISCHGDDGAKSHKGSPFIAGQQSEYLTTSLKAYRDGHRKSDAMKPDILKLSDAEITNIAAYYASLKSRWEPLRYKAKDKDTGMVSKADVARGKEIAKPCLSCHGEDGNSKQVGIPSLAGLQPAYLRTALKDYFKGNRKDSVMKVFSHSIDGNEVKQLAAFMSTLTRNSSPITIKGQRKRGGQVSNKNCAGCHGVNGNSQNPEIPSLAGQNPTYLVKAMQAYANGQRNNPMMKTALKGLPGYLYSDIAAFYAEQKPEKFGAREAKKDGKFDPIGEGAVLAKTCNSCHGENGNSTKAGIPSLTRLYPDYLKKAIGDYKSGSRDNNLMKSFVTALSEDDIEKLTLYYATQQPAAAGKSSKGDVKAGEQLSLTCAGCHGERGNSEQSNVPSLAGQRAGYIINAVKGYQSGMRKHADMQKTVKDMKPVEIDNVAAYYAIQSPTKPKVNIPENPVVLSAKCDRCHGGDGFSAVLNIPRIGGQVESYLVKSLNDYKHETRTNSAMHAMSDVLGNLEIQAIANYYSGRTKQP